MLPMAILAGGAQTLLGLTPLGSGESDFMLEGINAIVFGLAAVVGPGALSPQEGRLMSSIADRMAAAGTGT